MSSLAGLPSRHRHEQRGSTIATHYKAAIIGLGRISSTIDDEVRGTRVLLPFSHMGAYLEVPDVEVVGACDLYPEQRDAFGKRYGFDGLYADYKEMLEKQRPDIVSVCTSAKYRAEVVATIAAMDAGVKAIWAEKPISVSLAEGDAMVAGCRSAGIKLAINCRRRWDPWWNRVRELIDGGTVGEVLQVNAFQRGELSHNSHVLNLARYLAGGDGRVAWVFGEADNDEAARGEDDIGGNCYLAFENGVRAYVRLADQRSDLWVHDEADVMGSEGRIRALNNGSEFELWRTIEGHREPSRLPFPRPQRIAADGVRAVRDLVRCIETGKEPNCSGDDGLHDLEVAVALRESHRQGGRRVDLPPGDRTQRIVSSEDIRFPDLPRAMVGDVPIQERG